MMYVQFTHEYLQTLPIDEEIENCTRQNKTEKVRARLPELQNASH